MLSGTGKHSPDRSAQYPIASCRYLCICLSHPVLVGMMGTDVTRTITQGTGTQSGGSERLQL